MSAHKLLMTLLFRFVEHHGAFLLHAEEGAGWLIPDCAAALDYIQLSRTSSYQVCMW